MQIIVGIGILFCVLFVCSAAVSGIVQGNQGTGDSTSSSVANSPTQPPPSPTATPSPTPTPTVKQNIIQIVNKAASNLDKIDFTQNDGSTVVVQLTLSEVLDAGSARDIIQQNCFDIEQALWTAHISSLKDVDLAFRGPSVDKYGNNGISPYGFCDLTKATAAKFNWSNLDSSSAWDAYDQAQFYTIIEG